MFQFPGCEAWSQTFPMYLNKIPGFLRYLLPSQLEWVQPARQKEIYLTFDDGPIPEITPWVLKQLDEHEAKATFFCVGDNVSKHPEVFQQLLDSGHSIGNHTHNHLKAWNTDLKDYLENVSLCNSLVNSKLFRPPHGQITPRLARKLSKEYRLIMWTLLSRDFDQQVSPYEVLKTSVENTKPGTIIVFHDSQKAWNRLEYTLPRYLEHFTNQGFTFRSL